MTTPADVVLAPPPSPIRRVFVVQYLRAIAAMAVVIYHIMEADAHKFTVGSAGVDIFFVISGYIMWTVSNAKSQPPLDFWIKRIARVAPPYWLVTILTVVAAMLKPKAFWMVTFSIPALLRSLAFIPYLSRTGSIEPIVVQGWTLNYEMFFYLIFAALLFTPIRYRLWVTSVAFLGLAACHEAMSSSNPVARSYTDPLLLEFLAGVWVGEAQRRRWLVSGFVGGLLCVAALAVFTGTQVQGYRVDTWRPLLWGAPAAGLVYGGLAMEHAGRMPVWRGLSFLGDSSYSLYLIHILVLAVCAPLLVPHGFPIYAAGAFAASLGVSSLFYIYIEKPLHVRLAAALRTSGLSSAA